MPSAKRFIVEDNVEELVWRIHAATREGTTEVVPSG
jgi:hypothetical protein